MSQRLAELWGFVRIHQTALLYKPTELLQYGVGIQLKELKVIKC